VHGPEQRHDQRQPGGVAAEFFAQRRLHEGPPQNAEQGEAGEEMNRQVQRMVTPNRVALTAWFTANDRLSTGRPLTVSPPRAAGQQWSDRPEVADRWIVRD